VTEPVPLAIAHPVLAELREVGTWSGLCGTGSAIDPDDVAAAAAALAASDVAFGDQASAAARPWFRDRVVAAVRNGAAAAFEEFAVAARAGLPADLRPHTERIDASMHAFLVTSELRHLLEAEQAWVAATAAVDIEALPAALRLGLLCDATVLHETAWAATRDATRLDRLIGVLELVLSWFREGPDGVPAARLDLDPRLATVTGRLAAARRNRYDTTGDRTDLDRAATMVKAAVSIVAPDSPDRGRWCMEAGVIVSLAPDADVDGALELWSDVASWEPPASPLRRRAFAFSVRLLLTRTGPGDVAAAAAALRGELTAHPADSGLSPAQDLFESVAALLVASNDPVVEFAISALGGLTGDPEAGAVAERMSEASGLLQHAPMGSPQPLDRRIALLAAAVRLDPNGRRTVDRRNDLAAALQERFTARGDPDDLDTGIGILWSDAPLDRSAPGEVIAANTLGALLLRRFELRGDLADLDVAIAVLSLLTAPDTAGLSPTERSGIGGNLANALLLRASRGGDLADLDTAAAAADAAVAVVAEGPPDALARATSVRAVVHADRWSRSGSSAELDAAITDWAAALPAFVGADAAMIQYNLGNAQLSRFETDPGPAADLDDVIALLRAALAGLPRSTPDGAYAANRLADALSIKAGRTGDDRLEQRSRRWSARALHIAIASSPEAALRVGWDAGLRAERHGRWQEAADVYSSALGAMLALVASTESDPYRDTWLALGYGVPTRAAYALLRCDRPDDAVVALEAGRGRLLSEAIGRGDPDPALRPTFEQVMSSIVEPLVYLVPGAGDGRAILLEPGSPAHVIMLPDLGEAMLGQRVAAFRSATDGSERQWHRTLERVGEWLGTALAPVRAALSGARVTLIPTGAVAFLPLHAAWQGTGSDRATWLDELVISYAPTATVLAAARRRAAPSGAPRTLLAVADPVPGTQAPLEYARAEVAVAARRTDHADVLAGAAATLAAVRDRLDGARYVHVAAHAIAAPGRPRASGIVLGGDEMLTVGDLAHVELAAARLAFLSACETGVPGAQAPDEVLDLGATLFGAGVDAVISTMWPVWDGSALLVATRFYELFDGNTDPAGALAAAQRWIRGTTSAAMRAHWTAEHEAGRLPDETFTAIEDVLRGRSETHDFADADHWAAFRLVGF
jgi:CHAT domain-containing protein